MHHDSSPRLGGSLGSTATSDLRGETRVLYFDTPGARGLPGDQMERLKGARRGKKGEGVADEGEEVRM